MGKVKQTYYDNYVKNCVKDGGGVLFIELI